MCTIIPAHQWRLMANNDSQLWNVANNASSCLMLLVFVRGCASWRTAPTSHPLKRETMVQVPVALCLAKTRKLAPRMIHCKGSIVHYPKAHPQRPRKFKRWHALGLPKWDQKNWVNPLNIEGFNGHFANQFTTISIANAANRSTLWWNLSLFGSPSLIVTGGPNQCEPLGCVSTSVGGLIPYNQQGLPVLNHS